MKRLLLDGRSIVYLLQFPIKNVQKNTLKSINKPAKLEKEPYVGHSYNNASPETPQDINIFNAFNVLCSPFLDFLRVLSYFLPILIFYRLRLFYRDVDANSLARPFLKIRTRQWKWRYTRLRHKKKKKKGTF